MLTIPGYTIAEQLYESEHSLIFRGQRAADQCPIIFKYLKSDYPRPAEIARFKREYDLTRKFEHDGIIHAYGLEPYQNTFVMLLEDCGGQSLAELLPQTPLALRAFLQVAVQIATSLGIIHQQNIVHKDINPANIIWNPHTGQVKIIDFGIATIMSRETATLQDTPLLEGTLAYIAPEQTGRMNRGIDCRTDLYAFGVTCYHLLTGHPPFTTNDPLELVHAHLAQLPVPPCDLPPHPNPLPEGEGAFLPSPFRRGVGGEVLSAIIMKLLAKMPEERYQSAYGLRCDLQKCLAQLGATGTIEALVPGLDDVSDKFQLPQKLYGRATELGLSGAVFELVRTGATAVLAITGEAGVGKSALVQELRAALVEQSGVLITGRFDQFTQHLPYSALIQAFQMLLRQTLMKPAADVQQARERLFQAVGPNGQVIIEVIPELEMFTGPQPPVPELPPDKAQNRFQLVIRNVMQAIARPENPCVLFLDNAHWADVSSLKLLEFLLTETTIPYLLLVLAYRPEEVPATHPLNRLLQHIPPARVKQTALHLEPLPLAAVTSLLAETLRMPPAQVLPLAEIVVQKTGGNPFFLRQFLQTLVDDGLLQFDLPAKRWQWEVARVQQQAITTNVIAVMNRKIQKLPAATQVIVKAAACIGNQFELATLADLQAQSLLQVARALWPAIQEGLLVPQEDPYPYVDTDADQATPFAHAGEVNVPYGFLHTRVQHAAYALLSVPEQQRIHLQLGRVLLAQLSAKQQGENIFELANHFNRGQHSLTDSVERLRVAELNLRAGKKALAATAYQPADAYVQQGIGYLPTESWRDHYELTFALFSVAAETAYLTGQFTQMHSKVAVIFEHAQNVLDQVPAYETLIHAAITQNDPLQAIAHGRHFLGLLGIHLPPQPGKIRAARDMFAIKLLVAGQPIAQIADRLEGTPANYQAAMRIMSLLGAPAYFAQPELMPALIFHASRLSLKYGNTVYSAFAYAGYGLMLCGIWGELQTGYQFGKLALEVLARLNAKEQHAKVLHVVYTCLWHWQAHYRETLQPLLEGYRVGLETGDWEFGCYATATYGYLAFFSGKPLPELIRELEEFRTQAEQFHQPIAYNCLHIYQQTIALFIGQAAQSSVSSAHAPETDPNVRALLAADDRHAVFQYYFNQLLRGYVFHAYQSAVLAAERAAAYLDGALAIACVPLYYFYDALARLAMIPDLPPAQRRRMLRRVAANQRKLKKWTRDAPMNYQHRWYLIEAERFRVLQQPAPAMTCYDHAIALARQHQYLQDEALANELAAAFYAARGQPKVAQAYIRDARYGYLRWGAEAKVAAIDEQYPNLAAQSRRKTDFQVIRPSTTLTTTATAGTNVHLLDLTTVMKASQAISGEIVLAKLLTQLMAIVIENAGAQKGVLILARHGQWLLEAEGRVEMHQERATANVQVLHSIPLEHATEVSAAVINYVLKMKHAVVLPDATQAEMFAADPYILTRQPKSLLCTPILHGGQLIGAVYLENNLATDVFTPDRLELLQVLSAQAAISLENARLYQELQQYNETLETTVAERTTELRAKNMELQELNASKDKFFSIISHDLRSPFMALLGYTELMVQNFESYTPQRLKEFVARVHTSAERLYALLENLLTWSRVQRGVMEYQPEDIDLHHIAEDTVELFLSKAEQKQVTLQQTLPPTLPVQADLQMLKTVVRNLVSNALKFTPSGGHVTISAQQLEDQIVEMAITDTGYGIGAEDLAKLFRLDVHYSTTGTAGETGTGLGLLLCKDLVEKNGGQLRVESAVGCGTTFRFTVLQQPQSQ